MRGEGRVFQRGRVWWFAYMAPTPTGGAKEVRESSESDSESVARKMLRDRVRQVANHRGGVRAFAGPQAERLTVREILDSLESDYRQRRIKSLRRTLSHIKPVRDFFGDHRAQSLTADQIRGFIAYCEEEEDVSGATINRRLAQLNAAYELALREERLTRKPYIAQLPEGDARSGFFEADQHALMLEHLPRPLDRMARFAYRCGWRRDEVRTLRWEWVDRDAREVKLPDTKNSDPRTLPLDEELADLFAQLWEERAYTRRGAPAISEFVFHVNGRPVSDTQFSRLWDRARDAAGAAVEGRIFHDYRRTAVRNLMRAGVQQSVAMAITGHRSDAIFRRYNITSTEDRLDALNRQKAYLDGRPRDGGNVALIRPNSDKTRTHGQRADAESTT
jgi:integrase